MRLNPKWLDRAQYIFRHPRDFARLLSATVENHAIEASELIFNRKKVKCSICGWSGNSFRNFLERHFIIYRQQCPVCSSLRRNRGMLDYLLKLPRPPGTLTVVETGPFWANSKALGKFFSYVAVDLKNPPSSRFRPPNFVRARAEALPFSDNFAWIVISSHCLEHIEDDIGALREYRRILRSDGHLLLDVPLEGTPTSAKIENAEHLGHKWRYGLDFPNRVSSQGFSVETKIYFDLPNPSQEETFFHCRPIK